MNSPDSPTRKIENDILLEQSGELSPEEQQALRQALKDRPDLADWAREIGALQELGRSFPADHTPALPEISRERILQAAAAPKSKALPRLLALAALLVLALGLLPHLSRYSSPTPQDHLTTQLNPIQSSWEDQDPLLRDLDYLQDQLAVWSETSMEDPWVLEDENDWAEILLSMEEPI
jgi:anti-sigma factor RsiW